MSKSQKEKSELVVQALKTATILWREGRRFFKPFGLTDAQFNVLNILSAVSDGMSQRELSEALVVDNSNTTVLLDRMSKRGWIQREDVPGDRRRYRVVWTAKGREIWKEVFPHYIKVMESVVKNVLDRDAEICMKVLVELEQSARSRK